MPRSTEGNNPFISTKDDAKREKVVILVIALIFMYPAIALPVIRWELESMSARAGHRPRRPPRTPQRHWNPALLEHLPSGQT